MLDRIFGSGNLEEKVEELENTLDRKKEEIAELKKKLDDSKKRLEKETKRAKEAITNKQSVDRELKKSNQKIETLKDKLSRLERENSTKRKFRNVLKFSPQENLTFIKEIERLTTENNTLYTQYFSDPKDAGLRSVGQFSRNIDSETGYVAFWDDMGLIRSILVPPFPIMGDFFEDDRFHFEKLEAVFNSNFKVIFVSLHAGKSGVGLLDGRDIEQFKVIRSRVKGKHSKGGFSQGRFERGRKKQIREHKEKVLEFLGTLDKSDVDYVVLNGNEKIVNELEEELSFGCPIVVRNLNVSEASKENSERFAEEIWSSRLYIL